MLRLRSGRYSYLTNIVGGLCSIHSAIAADKLYLVCWFSHASMINAHEHSYVCDCGLLIGPGGVVFG